MINTAMKKTKNVECLTSDSFCLIASHLLVNSLSHLLVNSLSFETCSHKMSEKSPRN